MPNIPTYSRRIPVLGSPAPRMHVYAGAESFGGRDAAALGSLAGALQRAAGVGIDYMQRQQYRHDVLDAHARINSWRADARRTATDILSRQGLAALNSHDALQRALEQLRQEHAQGMTSTWAADVYNQTLDVHLHRYLDRAMAHQEEQGRLQAQLNLQEDLAETSRELIAQAHTPGGLTDADIALAEKQITAASEDLHRHLAPEDRKRAIEHYLGLVHYQVAEDLRIEDPLKAAAYLKQHAGVIPRELLEQLLPKLTGQINEQWAKDKALKLEAEGLGYDEQLDWAKANITNYHRYDLLVDRIERNRKYAARRADENQKAIDEESIKAALADPGNAEIDPAASSQAQRTVLEIIEQAGDIETDWDRWTELVLMPRRDLLRIDPLHERGHLADTQYLKLLELLKDAGTHESVRSAAQKLEAALLEMGLGPKAIRGFWETQETADKTRAAVRNEFYRRLEHRLTAGDDVDAVIDDLIIDYGRNPEEFATRGAERRAHEERVRENVTEGLRRRMLPMKTGVLGETPQERTERAIERAVEMRMREQETLPAIPEEESSSEGGFKWREEYIPPELRDIYEEQLQELFPGQQAPEEMGPPLPPEQPTEGAEEIVPSVGVDVDYVPGRRIPHVYYEEFPLPGSTVDIERIPRKPRGLGPDWGYDELRKVWVLKTPAGRIRVRYPDGRQEWVK